ncbi:hypothetical protein [Sorangium sp. So ce1078]
MTAVPLALTPPRAREASGAMAEAIERRAPDTAAPTDALLDLV